MRESLIFPNATALPRRRWDLNDPGSMQFDVLVASSVFMYSSDPALWFRHVLAACKYFLMVDLVRRQRSKDSEFGSDGDCTRYGVNDAQPRVEQFFDLECLGDKLLCYRTYYGGRTSTDERPMHIIALFRGDLAHSIPPAGIQSILKDLASQR